MISRNIREQLGSFFQIVVRIRLLINKTNKQITKKLIIQYKPPTIKIPKPPPLIYNKTNCISNGLFVLF